MKCECCKIKRAKYHLAFHQPGGNVRAEGYLCRTCLPPYTPYDPPSTDKKQKRCLQTYGAFIYDIRDIELDNLIGFAFAGDFKTCSHSAPRPKLNKTPQPTIQPEWPPLDP